MRVRMLVRGLLAALLAVSPAHAASVDVVAELNPGQSGPLFGWSLRISTAPGVGVGAIGLMLTGFDGFDFSFPGISLPDSVYFDDFDGRDLLFISAPAPNGVLVPGGTSNLLLGTLSSHFNTVALVKMENCDDACGGTIFSPLFDVIFDYSLVTVPEPSHAALVVAALLALRTARRRAA